jgi:DNA repair protein RecO (recombination protein O)
VRKGHYKTDAVVLGATNYGESDVILTLLTAEFGKIKGVAKGARRSRRRFVGTIDPPARISVLFHHHGGHGELKRVEDSKLIDGYAGLKADIERFSAACYMVELSDALSSEGDEWRPAYGLLTSLLFELSSGMAPDATSRFFEARILKLMGLMPHLTGCVICRKRVAGEPKAVFSSARGGLLCRECSPGSVGAMEVSLGTAMFLSTASTLDADKLRRLKPNQQLLGEADLMLEDFIRFHTGREFKTRRFMDSMRSAKAVAVS